MPGNTIFISLVEHDISLVRCVPLWDIMFNTNKKKWYFCEPMYYSLFTRTFSCIVGNDMPSCEKNNQTGQCTPYREKLASESFHVMNSSFNHGLNLYMKYKLLDLLIQSAFDQARRKI